MMCCMAYSGKCVGTAIYSNAKWSGKYLRVCSHNYVRLCQEKTIRDNDEKQEVRLYPESTARPKGVAVLAHPLKL